MQKNTPCTYASDDLLSRFLWPAFTPAASGNGRGGKDEIFMNACGALALEYRPHLLERHVFLTIHQAKQACPVAVLSNSPVAARMLDGGSVRTLWAGAFG